MTIKTKVIGQVRKIKQKKWALQHYEMEELRKIKAYCVIAVINN